MEITEKPSSGRESRRKHHKSRNGCITCKQRSVKCDEVRPRCGKCALGNRPCSYRNGNPNSPDQHGSGAVTTDPTRSTDGRGSFTAMDMGFLYHAECNLGDVLALQGDVKPIITAAIDNALAAPYLLDQLLALSALHRAMSDSPMASTYHQQATMLQTRALSIFNEAKADISESNHIASFLFATFLGVHVLGDTLAYHHYTLAAFVSAFVNYIRLHRGVRTVTSVYWTQILESDLKPLLYITQWADKANQLEPGDDTLDVRRFLESVSSLSPESLESCLEALRQVQWVLDMAKQEPSRADVAIHATMAWPLVIPDSYIDALYQHRPEALVVLSCYAAIIHRHRNFWVFGNTGSALVDLIGRHIGPFWDEAMAWPRGQLILYKD